MNIIVCVKQVPNSKDMKFNSNDATIVREGVESILNPSDTFAIEEALKIKDRENSKVTVMSMGVLETEKLLQKTIALGIDQGVLLSDVNFAGADTLATAYTLSLGIKEIGDYHLIICGNEAIDGNTGQVGPSLAEQLDIPHITHVISIEEIGDSYIVCKRRVSNGLQMVKIKLPALISVENDINIPRLPSIKGMVIAQQQKIKVLDSKALNANINLCGLNGSPTRVMRTFVPEYENKIEMLTGDMDKQINYLIEKIESFTN